MAQVSVIIIQIETARIRYVKNTDMLTYHACLQGAEIEEDSRRTRHYSLSKHCLQSQSDHVEQALENKAEEVHVA